MRCLGNFWDAISAQNNLIMFLNTSETFLEKKVLHQKQRIFCEKIWLMSTPLRAYKSGLRWNQETFWFLLALKLFWDVLWTYRLKRLGSIIRRVSSSNGLSSNPIDREKLAKCHTPPNSRRFGIPYFTFRRRSFYSRETFRMMFRPFDHKM